MAENDSFDQVLMLSSPLTLPDFEFLGRVEPGAKKVESRKSRSRDRHQRDSVNRNAAGGARPRRRTRGRR